MRRILISVSAVLAVLMLSGCGLAQRAVERATEEAVGKAIESATGVSVDEDEGTVTIKGSDGEEVQLSGTEGKLAEGFPLPLYQGAKVNSSARMSASGKSSYTADITYAADTNEVANFYEAELKKLGIAEVARIESDNGSEFMVILSGESDTASAWITLNWQKESKSGSLAIIYGEK